MRPFGCDSNRNADQGSFVQLVPLRPSSRRTQMILGTSWSYISKNWMHMVHSTHSTLIALIFWSAGQAICNHQATLHRDPKISPRMLETLANSFELWTDQCWILDLAGWLVDVLTFARASIGQLSHLERAMRFKGRVLGRFSFGASWLLSI